jgi:hypothetical protein
MIESLGCWFAQSLWLIIGGIMGNDHLIHPGEEYGNNKR